MSEIFSAIRLKDRVIIAVLMSAYALLLVGVAGAATVAGLQSHVHDYSFSLNKIEDGEFEIVGTCQVDSCKDAVKTWSINNEDEYVTSVKINPTCVAEGKIIYSFTPADSYFGNKTYTYTESIPALGDLGHKYDCQITTENGVTTVTGHCVAEGCDAPELVITNATDLKIESTVSGTCISPKEETYTYTADGVNGSFVAVLDKESDKHVLNGRPASDYEIAPGVYMYGTNGITSISGMELTTCGQKTIGVFQCEGCGATVSALVGLPDHKYVQDVTTMKQPTKVEEGYVYVKCSNSGCTDTKKVNMPKIGDSSVTLTSVSIDEANLVQTWKYSYYYEKYDVTVYFEYETDWRHDHVFVHDPSLTEVPSLTRTGKAIVKCSVEGCSELKQIVLPKVQVGSNPENGDNSIYTISTNTEQQAKTVIYTYTSEIYGFTETLEIVIGQRLSHAYNYYLEPYGNGFVVIGKCDQPECQRPEYIKEENVIPVYTNTSTCQTFGEEIWSHPTDSNVKPFVIPSFDLVGHNMQFGEDNVIKQPTTSEPGKAAIKCANAGCDVECEFDLPKVVLGAEGNSVVIGVGDGIQIVGYSYIYVDGDIRVTVDLVLVIEEAHVHSFTYELVPMEDGEIGKFDFIGTCSSYEICGGKVVTHDVTAKLIEDNSTCTGGIKQSWAYIFNNEIYYCYLNIMIPDGHHMDFDIKAPTTIRPTLTEKGSLEIFCTKCGERQTIDLPVLVPGVNATISDQTDKQITYKYEYFYEYNEFDPDGHFTVELLVEVFK